MFFFFSDSRLIGVCLFCFSLVTAVDSGTKALEFLGLVEDPDLDDDVDDEQHSKLPPSIQVCSPDFLSCLAIFVRFCFFCL